MTDSDALFQQIRQTPDDEILLGAYADCLDEEGRHERSALVREYQQMMQSERYRKLVPELPADHLKRDLLKWKLGISDIQVGTRLVSYGAPYGCCYPSTYDWGLLVATSPVENGEVTAIYNRTNYRMKVVDQVW